jgi:hypothetical protein
LNDINFEVEKDALASSSGNRIVRKQSTIESKRVYKKAEVQHHKTHNPHL